MTKKGLVDRYPLLENTKETAMKTKSIPILAAAALAGTSMTQAQTVYEMFGSSSAENAYNWSSTEQYQPWGGSTVPSELSDYIRLNGVRGDGSADSYVNFDVARASFDYLMVGSNAASDGLKGDHYINFTSAGGSGFYFKNFTNKGHSSTVAFTASNGGGNVVIYDNTYLKLGSTTTPSGTTKTGTTLKIGKGVELNFQSETALYTSDSALEGQLVVAGKFSTQTALNMRSAKTTTKSAILVEKGGTANINGVLRMFEGDTKITVDGKLTTNGLVVKPATTKTTFILGDEGLIDFGDANSAANIANGKMVYIENFRENAIRMGTANESEYQKLKALIESSFFVKSGGDWKNGLSLTSDGYLTAVPEPASYTTAAAAIALAAAACRRRK